ncbi:cytochrome P450 monooxygenase CYP63 [Phlegmacium glaucopus]|nr:cytochrome P450 monooxygenase CYP63 [Phlegmacium glaucopus]
MNPANYRARFLLDLFRVFILPIVVLSLVLSALHCRPGFFSIPLHLVFILSWAIVKGAYEESRHDRDAKSLGAKAIPRVVGKWPGNVDLLFRMMRAFDSSYILDVYLQLFEEYQCTTLNLRILWCDNIITMDQEHSKFVVATGFQYFWRGDSQKERLESFLGEGIFNRDDEKWKLHRAIARPFFARERIADFEIFERHWTRTLAILSSLESSNTPCEAQDLYCRFTLDAASEFLFGKNLDTLSASLPVPGTAMGPKGSATQDTWGSFTRAFELAEQNVTNRGRLGSIWPLFELLKDKNEEHSKVIRAWLDPLVQDALEDKQRLEKMGVVSPIADKSFMQHLADSTNDPVLIRDQLLNMLLASRDTTACVLTFITYFLAIHPEAAQRLRAEVLEHCGPTSFPTFQQFRDMKYMRAVINETLRLFPPVPLNVRESRSTPCIFPQSDRTHPHTSKQPLYMPPATTVAYFPLLTQRNPALWGDDADNFDPERWIDPERSVKYVANPAMFSPFSSGPRICIGQNYAYNEMSYFLVRLLQQFDRFTLASEVQPEGSLPPAEWKHAKGRQAIEKIWPSAALTLYVKGGLWVRFHRAH